MDVKTQRRTEMVVILILKPFSLTLDSMKAALKPDRFWKKSRIAARILLKQQRGALNKRDRRLARTLAEDPGVTNRLIDQAVHWLKAPPTNAH
jgi:hypothetical protein